MPSAAISGHGAILSKNTVAAQSTFTTIGEMRNITPAPYLRNDIEITNQASTDDEYTPGMRRKGDLGFTIGYLPGSATHDEVTGLVKSYHDGEVCGWKLLYPDANGVLVSGYVKNIAPDIPVDGGLVATVAIRPTGPHLYI